MARKKIWEKTCFGLRKHGKTCWKVSANSLVHFAPPCSTPMSPKLGHMVKLSCSMLVLHGFCFGTSAWRASAIFWKKLNRGALWSKNQFSFSFRTTLQHSNESQTWPHGGVELQHAGVAWVLLWDLCLACISNFLKKVKQGSALEQKSIFIFISHHLAALQWVPNLATCWSWAAACWCCMGFALGPLLTYLVYMQTNAEEWSQPRRETLVLSFKPKLA